MLLCSELTKRGRYGRLLHEGADVVTELRSWVLIVPEWTGPRRRCLGCRGQVMQTGEILASELEAQCTHDVEVGAGLHERGLDDASGGS